MITADVYALDRRNPKEKKELICRREFSTCCTQHTYNTRVMEIPRHQFQSSLPAVQKAIDECEFIAIDTELSGT